MAMELHKIFNCAGYTIFNVRFARKKLETTYYVWFTFGSLGEVALTIKIDREYFPIFSM